MWQIIANDLLYRLKAGDGSDRGKTQHLSNDMADRNGNIEKQRDSLGRFLKGTASDKRKDYTGMKFGYLTVVGMEYRKDKTGKSRTFALCKCICGKEVIRQVDNLDPNRKSSCGCMKKKVMRDACRKDLTGHRFGRLVVKEMIWDERPTRCKCECDCGNECEVIATQLTYGKTRSCGCLWRETISKSNTKDFTGMVTDTGIEFLYQHQKNKNGVWEWVCRCPCGNIFYDIPARVVGGHRVSCGCALKSSGETIVENILVKNNIPYHEQYTFNSCKYILPLRFDFAVMNGDNVLFLIEYDGAQHYVAVDWFGGEEALKICQVRDEIKNKYCEENKIPLLRLPYTLSTEEIENKIISQYKCCESVETAGCSQ